MVAPVTHEPSQKACILRFFATYSKVAHNIESVNLSAVSAARQAAGLCDRRERRVARARLEEGSSCAARAEPTSEQGQGVRELNHGGMILQRRGASIVKVPVNPGCGGGFI